MLAAQSLSRRLVSRLPRWGDGLLNVIFPPQCVSCGREGEYICAACRPALPYLTPPFCQSCGEPIGQGTRLCRTCTQSPLIIDGIRSVFFMDGPIREAIHALKYRGVRVLAGPLGQELTTALDSLPERPDALVPVPLHSHRLRQRGYNQAALLARSLGHSAGLPVLEDALVRHVATPPQARAATREDRLANVAGAFTAPGDLSDTHVLLIDDVCTTGATLDACAQALYSAGARHVYGLTLAREV